MQNDTKKHHKRKKRTHMTGDELKQLRREINFAPRDMCACLVPDGYQPMPRRTYQDYEAGKRGIPAEIATRTRELHRKNREFVAGIASRVDAAEEGK